MVKTMQGKIHGKIIELEEDPGLDEGQDVKVQMTVVLSSQPWGEGLRRCAGALADQWTEEDDRVLEKIYQDRKRDRRQEVTE